MDGGTTWFVQAMHSNGTSYTSASVTQNVECVGGISGATNFRVRATAAWTGTATIKIVETVNPSTIFVTNPIRLCDSTTPFVGSTIKGNSTPAGATDTAIVVAISPNNQPTVSQGTTPWTVSGTGTINSAVPTTGVFSGVNVAGNLQGMSGVSVSANVALRTDNTSIAGTATVTAAAGVQKVGIVGNAGATVDAAPLGTAPTNAVQTEVRAATAYPTAATDGQVVVPMADKAGRQVTVLNAPRDLVGSASVQSTTSSNTSLIAAGGSGVFTDITTLILTNESATPTIVSLSDGTITYKIALAGNGGGNFPLNTPLPASSSNTAWNVSNSASVNVDCVVIWVKNK